MRVYDSATNKMDTMQYLKDPNIWYLDSLIIEETFYTKFYMNDTTFEKTWSQLPYEYTFIDLPNKNFYVFSSFSDTAILIRKYTQPDSVKGSIANFWGLPSFFKDQATELIGDTIINGINYKMFRKIEYLKDTINHAGELVPSYNIAYLDCWTNKHRFFTCDKKFSDQQGCPVKRTDRYGIGEGFRFVTEILNQSDTLTAQEQKIFKAWAKYAKDHPIEK